MARKEPHENPQYVVTLVHGTFARNANWIQPGSTLRNYLESHLEGGAVFVPFQWSGKNSHRARLAAADRLVQAVYQSVSKHPKSKQYVIAHSHGGNVALYARAHLLSGWKPKLICLATPFLRCTRRSERFFWALTIFMWLSAFALGPSLGAWLSMAIGVLDPESHSGWQGAFTMVIVVPLTFLLLAIGTKFVWSLEEQSEARARVFKTEPQSGADSLLAVKLERDEASLWLRLMMGLSNVPRYFWDALEWSLVNFVNLWLYAMFAAVGVATIGALLEAFGIRPSSFFAIAAGVGFLLAPAAYIASAPVLLVTWLFARLFRGGVHGLGESIFDSVLLSTWVEDGFSRVLPTQSRNKKRPKSLLHHSQVYEDERVLEMITAWIKNSPGKGSP